MGTGMGRCWSELTKKGPRERLCGGSAWEIVRKQCARAGAGNGARNVQEADDVSQQAFCTMTGIATCV